MASPDQVVRKVSLNNKSRKGEYYYIREKGRKGRYYKLQKGISIDNYIQAYRGGIRVKKRGVRDLTAIKGVRVKDYLKTVKRRPKIETLLQTGITEVEVPTIMRFSRSQFHDSYKKMLAKHLRTKDTEILNVLAQEENVKKLKHRIQTDIIIGTEDGRVMIPLRTYNKTLEEVSQELSEVLQGSFTGKKLQDNLIRQKKYKLSGVTRGVDLGKTYESYTIADNVKVIKTKLTFTKGRK